VWRHEGIIVGSPTWPAWTPLRGNCGGLKGDRHADTNPSPEAGTPAIAYHPRLAD